MTGIAINGSLGFAMILTVLFRMGDVDAVLAENPAFPFMAIFHQAVQSRSGAAVMASIVMVLTISANVGFSASTSRICWAFARDRGLPGWRVLSKVCILPLQAVNSVDAKIDQRPNLDSCECGCLHKLHCLPPGPHQHWIYLRLQRGHFGFNCRTVLLISLNFRPPPLPTLYRSYPPKQWRFRP